MGPHQVKAQIFSKDPSRCRSHDETAQTRRPGVISAGNRGILHRMNVKLSLLPNGAPLNHNILHATAVPLMRGASLLCSKLLMTHSSHLFNVSSIFELLI